MDDTFKNEWNGFTPIADLKADGAPELAWKIMNLVLLPGPGNSAWTAAFGLHGKIEDVGGKLLSQMLRSSAHMFHGVTHVPNISTHVPLTAQIIGLQEFSLFAFKTARSDKLPLCIAFQQIFDYFCKISIQIPTKTNSIFLYSRFN